MKRRRQLEALKRGAERRSRTLQAQLDELDASEDRSDDPSEAESDDPIADPIEDRSVDRSEDRSGARVVPGRYSKPARKRRARRRSSEAAIDDRGEAASVDPIEDRSDDRSEDRGRGVRVAAALLGVRR